MPGTIAGLDVIGRKRGLNFVVIGDNWELCIEIST